MITSIHRHSTPRALLSFTATRNHHQPNDTLVYAFFESWWCFVFVVKIILTLINYFYVQSEI